MPCSLRCTVKSCTHSHRPTCVSNILDINKKAAHTQPNTYSDTCRPHTFVTLTHTSSICFSLSLEHKAATRRFVVTQTSLMWVVAETHLFGFVIKTIFQLTFHNYVSAFNCALLPSWPKNMSARLQAPTNLRAAVKTLIRIRWGHTWAG